MHTGTMMLYWIINSLTMMFYKYHMVSLYFRTHSIVGTDTISAGERDELAGPKN